MTRYTGKHDSIVIYIMGYFFSMGLSTSQKY